MNYKPILIICGEPNSVFSEILIKSLKIYKSKKPIILIGSSKLLNAQFMKLGLRLKLNELNLKKKSSK